MPIGGARTLMDLEDGGVERLALACEKCARTGNYAVASLIATHGAGERLPDLLAWLTRDCPTRAGHGLGTDRCGAVYRFGVE